MSESLSYILYRQGLISTVEEMNNCVKIVRSLVSPLFTEMAFGMTVRAVLIAGATMLC